MDGCLWKHKTSLGLSGIALGSFGKVRLPWASLESLEESCGPSRYNLDSIMTYYILLTTEREKNLNGAVGGGISVTV